MGPHVGVERLLSVFFATSLCLAMAFAMRRAVFADSSTVVTGMDGSSVVIAFVTYTVTAIAVGPAFAYALILSLLLHELGHVTAYRLLGHRSTRFRLVPWASALPISDRQIDTEDEAFFVAIMGPGLSVAPMALSLALSVALAGSAPDAAAFLKVFSVTCGAVNFLNLLPFWPLDGGKCARIAAGNFWPALAPGLTVFICSALASAALRTQSVGLFLLAALGAHSLLRKGEPARFPMGARNGLIALSAYAFTFAAHFSGAWVLVQQFF